MARARQDEERDDLDDEDVSYIVQTTRELLEELAEEAAKEEETEKVVAGADGAAVEPPTPVLVLGLPARDEVDELALWLFKRSLDETKVRFEAAGSKTVTAEMVQRVVKEQPALAFIAVVPPAGQAQVRYLCKRLRTRLPKLTILVGCWGVPEEAEQWVNLLRAAGANEVALTLRDSVNQLTPYISVAAGG